MDTATQWRIIKILLAIALLLRFMCYMRTAPLLLPVYDPRTTGPIAPNIYYFADVVSVPMQMNAQRFPNYNVTIFNTSTAATYMAINCPPYLAAFQSVVPFAFKADIFRICLLWTQGGIYLDDDLELLFDLTDLNNFSGNLLLVTDSEYDGIWNTLMISRLAGDPVLLCALQKIKDTAARKRRDLDLYEYTGPHLLGKCLCQFSDVGIIAYQKRMEMISVQTGTTLIHHHQQIRVNSTHYSKTAHSAFFV